jgi:uncharacterized protein (TIGR02421 family)
MTTTADTGFARSDLAIDHELADIAGGFRFLLDLTPVDLVEAQAGFDRTGKPPEFRYRDLEDDPEVALERLNAVAVDRVEDPTLATLLLAKHRELQLQLEMLACRCTDEFMGLGIELYGSVGPPLLREAEDILDAVAPPEPHTGPVVDAEEFLAAATAELACYRRVAPDLESHVEIRDGSTGVMVSNGDVLISPTLRLPESRVAALLQHEIGTHVVTHVNGAHQPIHVLAAGLAGYEETQEGLAVLAEHLVGGLGPGRLRQLAARVLAVHEMLGGADFSEVHHRLVHEGFERGAAFVTTMRVFRSGGLVKDAVYLRGLHDLVTHLGGGMPLETLWLGKMPLTAVPLVEALRRRGALVDPVLMPRYLSDAAVTKRLDRICEGGSLAALIEGAT